MPWTSKDVDAHNADLSPKLKRMWLHVANGALKKCQADGGKDCDAQAIRRANGVVKAYQQERA